MSTRSTAAAAAAGGAARRGRGHKERSKNFTELEKRTVLELIARHRDVLKQGRSNNATNKNKQLVWSTICEEVNMRCGGERPRTPAQVKMWYENYKKKCKMRAADPQPQEGPSILDGMLWQNIHPLDVKDDDQDAMENDSVNSVKEEECLPVNMSNGRLSSCNESNDALPNVLEPHIQIIPHSSPTPPPKTPLSVPLQNLHNHIMSPLHATFRHKSYQEATAPLNLSHLDSDPERKSTSSDDRKRKHAESKEQYREDGTATEEERLYYTAKRQHAIWEHEAKMRILNMELRQKEEIFSLQKQLFLIELKLKMDFLEKACSK